ncbi:YeiH family protein [Oceanimonas doudoroffii]|nr:YeiH family protein [Oceanimonas doudoroffii]
MKLIHGLALAGLLAVLSVSLAERMGGLVSPLIFAILFGLAVGNLLPVITQGKWHAGLEFCKKRLLRIGVAFYGINITLQQIADVGAGALLVDVLMLSSTLLLAWWLGRRWLGLDGPTALLVGAGSAICGAAAVLATEPVVRARPQQTAMAVGTVVVFGTLAMVIYPLLYPLLGLSPQAMGIYTGATVHEVAQVVAAGSAMGDDVAQVAVISKLTRVLMLAPVLVLLGWWLSRREPDRTASRAPLPWFAFGFVAVVIANSLLPLPAGLVEQVRHIDTWALTMAMAALGTSTQLGALRAVGINPLLLAGMLFVHLCLGGLLVTHMVSA